MDRRAEHTKSAGSGLGLAAALGTVAAAAGLAAWRKRLPPAFAGRTVAITGGSRGLGLVLARTFGAQGAKVALLARSRRELRRAALELEKRGVPVAAVQCDVRDRREVERALRRVVRQFGGIDVLVNNAGAIQVGPLEHMTLGDFERAMAIHFYGPLHTTLAALPYLRRAGGGRIVNITSVGGKIAAPHLAPYSASKFALVGLSDALRAELRKEQIFVTTVVPGLMRTGSPPNAQFKGRFRQEYAWFAIADSLPLLSMSAERAARAIVRACRFGSPRLVLGMPTEAAMLFNEIFPGTTARIAALVNRRLLPAPHPDLSPRIRRGWESRSPWAPSLATALTDRAAERNNETPGIRPAA